MSLPLEERLREYVALCEAGDTCAAIERFYAEDVVVFENHVLARAGRAQCLDYEREAVAHAKGTSRLRARARAVDAANDVTFVEWVIRFHGEDDRPMRLEEVAVQRWNAGRIAEERFYYHGFVDEGDE